jgi:hypothetical protein
MKSSKKSVRNRSPMEHSPLGRRHKRQSRRKLEMKSSMKRSLTCVPVDSAPRCTALASVAEFPARRGLPIRTRSFDGAVIFKLLSNSWEKPPARGDLYLSVVSLPPIFSSCQTSEGWRLTARSHRDHACRFERHPGWSDHDPVDE